MDQVKDHTSTRVFESAARKVKELQIITTWKHKQDIDDKPKVQFTLMSYDEMIEEPNKPCLSRYKREESQISFLVPRGFDPKIMGKTFEEIGKEMKKGKRSGSNWKIVEDIYEQHRRVFGSKRFRPQGIGTPKDKQAAKFHTEFGRGYNEEAPGNERKKRKRPKK